MKKIITASLILLMMVGCSSSKAGNDIDSRPSDETSQTVDKYDVNSTDSIIEPLPDIISDASDQVVFDDETGNGTESNTAGTGSGTQTYTQTGDPSLFDVSKLNYEDFDEFYGQVMYEGLPEGRENEPLGNANGIWKYNLKIRYDSADGYLYDELGYAEMPVHNTDDPPVKIVLHPRLFSDGMEISELTDEDVGYEPFGGGFDENNEIKLIGNNCVLYLKNFYAYEGREYLLADLWISEEETATFMMIRGQE